MKFPIAWHEECLARRSEFLEKELIGLANKMIEVKAMQNDCDFYGRQIIEARRRKRTEFDRDKFLKELRP